MSDRPAPDWLTRTTFAHRGLHSDAVPENSLAAAKAAEMRGFGIECDIQMSADGVPIVFHDWELKRLTGTPGSMQDLTGAELTLERLRGTQERPRTLESFLQELRRETPILIEVKSKPDLEISPACDAVSRIIAGSDRPLAVMSFDPRVAAWFADNAPEICRGLVGTDTLPNGFEHVWRDPDSLDLARPDFLAIDRRDLHRAEVKAWRECGKPLLSWTMRTKADWDQAEPLADALIAEGEALA